MRTYMMVVVAICMTIVKSHRFYFGYTIILMNTKKLWIFSVALLSTFVLAGCTATQPTPSDEQATTTEQEETVTATQTVEESSTQEEVAVDINDAVTNAGSYEEYSEQAVDQALADGKKVALFFHATRCPSCRTLDKEINKNLWELPGNTVTFKLDYDTQTELRKKYGVTMQHTIVVIDENKEEVAKDAWSADLAKIVSLLQ